MLDKRLKTYFDSAQIHVRTHGEGFVIQDRNGPEADAWLQYFERIVEKMPSTFVTFLNGHARTATVPAQWPNQFDACAEPYMPRPKQAKRQLPRMTLQEMYAKYGPTFGLSAKEEVLKPKPRKIEDIDFGVKASPYLSEMMRQKQAQDEAA